MSKEKQILKDKAFLKWLIVFASIVINIYLIVCAFDPNTFDIVGQSMFPTMVHGDRCIIVNKNFFYDLEYRRNDIIIASKDERGIVKRIVGLPGERIEIKDSEVKVDGKILYNSAILYGNMDEVRDITLGNDEYYLLGDNRVYSHDSRHDGPIKRHTIIGRVLYRWRSLKTH